MKTYEMIALAESDEETYRTGDMFYDKSIGFHDSEENIWGISAFDSDDEENDDLLKFIMLDGWYISSARRMTKSQIEKELGYEIKIIK